MEIKKNGLNYIVEVSRQGSGRKPRYLVHAKRIKPWQEVESNLRDYKGLEKLIIEQEKEKSRKQKEKHKERESKPLTQGQLQKQAQQLFRETLAK